MSARLALLRECVDRLTGDLILCRQWRGRHYYVRMIEYGDPSVMPHVSEF